MKQLLGVLLAFGIAAAVFGSDFTVSFILGDVSVKRGMQGWTKATMNEKLAAGDSIKTAKGASVQITASDPAAQIRLSENTEFVLGGAGSPGKRNSFKLLSGKIWSKVQKMRKDDSVMFDTPSAVAAVRGTIFILSIEPSGVKLFTVEGEMGFGKDAFALVGVGSGFIAGVNKDGSIDKPRPITDAERKQMMGGIPIFVKPTGDARGQMKNEIGAERNKSETVRNNATESRSSDLTAGRVLKDINGDIVRVEQILRKTDSKTINLINLTKRETGKYPGVSYLDIKTVFASDIPASLSAAAAASGLSVKETELRIGERPAGGGRTELKYWQGSYNPTTGKWVERFALWDDAAKRYQERDGSMADFKNVTAPADAQVKLMTKQELQLYQSGKYGQDAYKEERIYFTAYVINNDGKIIGEAGVSVNGANDIFAIFNSLAAEIVVTYKDLAHGEVELRMSDVVVIPDILLVFVQKYW